MAHGEDGKASNKMEEDYEAPFGADDSVLVKDLNFSYGDRKVRAVLVCQACLD